MSNETKKIHLALQGGGAHGAFTWGVLDALLTDGRLQFAGISGTSAGALNAVAVGHGWARAQGEGADPAEEARVALAHIWRRVMNLGAMSEGPGRLARLMLGALPGAWGRVSPYQSNPLDYNPLRQMVTEAIDFDGVARLAQPRVFVAATEVETGRAEIFSGKRLTVNAVMASCCLPQLFQAPEINGKTYWDGGYSSNPALQPLIEMGETDDILLVQINPLRRRGTPAAVGDIAARVDDLTFNASLIAQMRTIAMVNELIDSGVAPEGLRRIRMHRIGGDGALDELAPASKTTPEPQTVERLFELGRQAANRWLKKHLASVGEKGTVNIRRDYGDPLRLDFGTPESDGEDGADDAEGAAPG
ncbi:MAG: patatin-like phospholipase family protein [Proteobacteria bacterium]|nr:patatin-like phospholipase family protein [Pseudomonadota bacterium]